MTTTSRPADRRATLRCPFCRTLNRVDLSRSSDRPHCGDCGRPLLLDRPVKVEGADLARVLEGTDVPVLVDFYADWCGPCKAMAPLLDDLAGERTGRLLVVKIDTDRSPDAAVERGIRGIPTLILYDRGEEVGRQVGAVGRGELERLLEDVSGGPAD